MEEESLFFCNVQSNKAIEEIIGKIKDYSMVHSQQVYIIKKALGNNLSLEYEIDDVILILIPKHPILVLGYGDSTEDELTDYIDDLKEDLGMLSNKFEYNKILGRSRKWDSSLIQKSRIENFDLDIYLSNNIGDNLIRKIDLLISLLIGSINNINKIGIDEPKTILDKIKQKIVLFDGKQSRFIYLSNDKKEIIIQGMAGTGKTELLLYKLKEIFINEKDAVIAFTCKNKVLAREMKKRVPDFFNSMKIEEQIQWDEKMFVLPSWGSLINKESGMYRYICSIYDVPFYNYGQCSDFEKLCKDTLDLLNDIDDFVPCFDYIFIDESQDFGKYFFELCKKVANKKVFIAGDIFQNIFETNVHTDISPDYLLNNCYRTDPRTLMIAHSIGLGLYEHPPLSWLDDKDWESCGYHFERRSDKFILTRRPLRRFEDIKTEKTFEISTCARENYSEAALSYIQEIINNNPTVSPDDIAIIIISDFVSTCSIADKIEYEIEKKYNWYCAKGYETKEKQANKLFISNINNIKGLEFPFVICLAKGKISNNINYRNSIYMALTRSFLTSYFIVDDINRDFVESYGKAILSIKENGCLELQEPSNQEKKEMLMKINIDSEKVDKLQVVLGEVSVEYDDSLEKEQINALLNMLKPYKDESLEVIRNKAHNVVEALLKSR